MKTLDEILQQPRLQVLRTGEDGGQGLMMLDYKNPNKAAFVVWSNGGGWDHVSVSWPNRCPTWEEMCMAKRTFFYPEEVCVEYHPPQSEYVNVHPYCLHLWRLQQPGMPLPPSWMVGAKKGQSPTDARRQGEAELTAMERNREQRDESNTDLQA